ncbi:hypothetical protein Q8A67_023726 [Cirrhinus molitorella]|uniref:Uncharacterized protein n=1 Tax=Cirrhinus molitorella TaxID=172907 RepID=A0AA88P2I0_9TELE|nr:hypothetical protein Q8A67_023726 [Cirrhinus molitorella]
MSDGIYNDVIRTESEEKNKEKVEKTVDINETADCVSDHDFRTETKTHQPPQQIASDSVKSRSFRAAVVCLVLLCVLLLTAVIVLCVHIHTNYTNYMQETHQLITKITNLTVEKDELLTNNINLTDERDDLLTENDNLSKQREQLIQERNELVNSLHEISNLDL